jgi:hypothetical protein
MKLEGREIALFCKFWSVGQPVWIANVYNVSGAYSFAREENKLSVQMLLV